MFPNPIDLSKVNKEDTFEWTRQSALSHAWNQSVENYVFFSESFEDVTGRMKSIQETYLNDSNIGSSDYGAARILFTPESIGNQKTVLEQEIDTEQLKTNPNNTRVNALKEQIKSLESFDKAFFEFKKH